MKISNISRMAMAVFVVICSSSLNQTQAAPSAELVIVKHLKGAAHYSAAKGVWIPLKLDAIMKPGMLIRTAPESTVTILFKDTGGTLVANPNTILRITKLSSGKTGLEVVSDVNLDLIEGNVAGSQRKTSGLSSFQINVPMGFAQLNGSDYSISANGALSIFTGVGKVNYYSGAVQASVTAGNSFDPSSGTTSPVASPARASAAKGSQIDLAAVERPQEKPASPHGNNGVGNGEDPAPPGNPPSNDGPGTGPGNPGNGRPPRP